MNMTKRDRKSGVLDLRFQRKMRELRASNGMTQAELAERAGWATVNYVSQLETGLRGFSSETVETLAKIFHVDPVVFFLEEVEEAPIEPRAEDCG